MWERLKRVAGMWGIVGAIVGIFALGAGATYNLFMAFEPKGESNGQAASVHRRVDDLNARLDRFSTWAKEQISTLMGKQDKAAEQAATEYRAINQRLDSHNALLIEVLRAVKDDHAGAEKEEQGSWSLIDSARASTRKAAQEN